MITLSGISKSFTVRKKKPGAFLGLAREKTVVQALDGISFEIGRGEIVGYIGPNGAGKSTTIKIMGGILHPDSGTCEIMGRVPYDDRKRHVRHIGVVFGQRSSLWWDVPVIDSYELLRDIYGIDKKRFQENVAYLGESLGFTDLLNIPARQLSLGQRIRCEIAAALLHEPEILFLDEPTIGLDAVSKLAVRSFIKEINREKKTTVLLTTHDMNDIDALATRVMLISKGRLAYDGSFDEIKSKYHGSRTMTVSFAQDDFSPPISISSGSIIAQTPASATISFIPGVTSVQALINEISVSRSIQDFSVAEPPIEEIMAAVYKEMQL